MVQGYLNPSPGPPSPVPPSDPPQQEVRGPAGGDEVGGQWDHPTQQQVQRGGPAGWGPSPIFSSTDIREREDSTQGQMSVSTMVSLLNQLCKQKPAGNFRLPKLPESDYCLLCNHGRSVCLGKTCKGRSQPTRQKPKLGNVTSSGIPGLVPSGSSSTVLTTPTYTSTKKCSISSLSPSSSLFNPKTGFTSSLPSSSDISSKTLERKSPQKTSRPKQKDSEYDVKLRKKLLHILLKSSLNPDDAEKVKKKKRSSSNTNSLFRKLNISEVRCPRKLSKSCKPIPKSTSFPLHFSTSSDSLSSSTNPISATISSATQGYSHTFSENYNDVLSYLRTQVEDSKNSEIFEIFTDDETVGFELEVLRASSPESRRPQSPSPDRQQRVSTPRKQSGPSAPSSSGHTPRKDTPTKRKQSRYQCRISGCKDYLANAKTRDRHESHYCRYRSVESPGLINQAEFPVPPHLELKLDLLQCRVFRS